MYNVHTLERMRAAVGPIIGANVDPSHLFWQGMDPLAVIRALGPAVYHVHLKDTSGGRGDWAFGPLGSGHVDLPQIVRTLRSRGFSGPYSLEIEGYAGEDLTRHSRVERVRQSLRYLASLGIQPWPNDA